MSNNIHINLDCLPSHFSALTEEIDQQICTTEVDKADVYINLFKARQDTINNAQRKQILCNYDQRVRASYLNKSCTNLVGVRIVECARATDERPTDINLIADLVTLISDFAFEETLCEIYELRYADSHPSPFATGVDCVAINSLFSERDFADNIAFITEMLDTHDLSVNMAIILENFPETEAILNNTMEQQKQELQIAKLKRVAFNCIDLLP